MEIPEFETKKELHEFLSKNKQSIIAQKRAVIKFSDGFSYCEQIIKGVAIKAKDTEDVIKRTPIINTTNILDSHRDVHIKGIWDKTVSENRYMLYLQEHQMKFDKVIADGEDIKPFIKEYTWDELGFDFEGKTQALGFDVTIKKDRNPFMFDQFKNNRVKQNSVGMQYIKVVFCMNDEDYQEDYANWSKYVSEIHNKQALEGISYFWAIIEAKAIEGSAVLLGSNSFTPVLNTKSIPEPGDHSDDEPSNDTHEAGIDYKYLIENFKL
jgi:hypothetical protein